MKDWPVARPAILAAFGCSKLPTQASWSGKYEIEAEALIRRINANLDRLMGPILPANRLEGTWYGGGDRQVHHAPRALNSVAGCATPSHSCWRSCSKFHLWTGPVSTGISTASYAHSTRAMAAANEDARRKGETNINRQQVRSTHSGLQVLSCWLLVQVQQAFESSTARGNRNTENLIHAGEEASE